MKNPKFNIKLDQLDRRLKTCNVEKHLQHLLGQQPEKIQALVTIADEVKDTPLQGLPYTIAVLKSNFMTEKQIAEELSISVREVKEIYRTPNFTHLVNQMQGAIWSDLILEAQATIRHHLIEKGDKELAKWVLESTGQVQSSRPVNLHQHNNKTLVLGNSGINQQAQSDNTENIITSAEMIAEALVNRMNKSSSEPPPINIAQEM